MRFDVTRMRPADALAGAAAALLAVALFLPWFAFAGGREDAWRALTVSEIPAALAALGGIALVAATVTQRSPALPLAVAVLTAVVAFVAVPILAARAIDPPAGALARSYGLWLGLGSCAALAVAAVWSLRDERPFWGVPVRA